MGKSRKVGSAQRVGVKASSLDLFGAGQGANDYAVGTSDGVEAARAIKLEPDESAWDVGLPWDRKRSRPDDRGQRVEKTRRDYARDTGRLDIRKKHECPQQPGPCIYVDCSRRLARRTSRRTEVTRQRQRCCLGVLRQGSLMTLGARLLGTDPREEVCEVLRKVRTGVFLPDETWSGRWKQKHAAVAGKTSAREDQESGGPHQGVAAAR